MRKYLLVLIGLFFFSNIYSQTCSDDKVMVVLRVETDKWAENSWTLGSGYSIYTMVDKDTYFQKEIFLDTFCVGIFECLTFTIFDGFGDGIVEGGGFEIYVSNSLVLQESQFGLSKSFEVNCQPGTSCSQAVEVTQGTYQARQRDSWYSFTPYSIGTYTISTCNVNECDTRIWVYVCC